MRRWFKLVVALVIIVNIAGIVVVYSTQTSVPDSLDERKIKSRLDSLLEAAKEDGARRSALAKRRNELTLQTMKVLGRTGTIALLDRASQLEMHLFKPRKAAELIVEEPGPNGITEKKVILQKNKPLSKNVKEHILSVFNKIAHASFGPLDEERIEVRISHKAEVLYQGRYRVPKAVPVLEYTQEILFPVGGTTLPLQLRLRVVQMQAEPLQVRDSRFSSWLRDNGVLYGIYWVGLNGTLQPLWYNEPADDIVKVIQSSLIPWPREYTTSRLMVRKKVVSTWMKPMQYEGETALALAIYTHPTDTSFMVFLWVSLGLNIVVIIGLIVLSPPSPVLVGGELRKRKSTNRNTNISTLRSDDMQRKNPMASSRRRRNSDIVRESFKDAGSPDAMQGVKSDVLRSLLKKVRM